MNNKTLGVHPMARIPNLLALSKQSKGGGPPEYNGYWVCEQDFNKLEHTSKYKVYQGHQQCMATRGPSLEP